MSNSNPNVSHGSELQSILYYKFVFQKQYSKDELAIFLNKAPDTVYRYCAGYLPITADIARDIARFIASKNPKDTELLEFFCAPAGFIPVPKPNGRPEDVKAPRHLVQLSILTGHAQEAIEEALADGRIEKREYAEIQRYLTRLQQKAAELAAKIKAEVRG